MTEATATTAISTDPTRRARLAEFWYYFSENRGAVIGLFFFPVPGAARHLRSAGGTP